jgi:hypothetical protein
MGVCVGGVLEISICPLPVGSSSCVVVLFRDYRTYLYFLLILIESTILNWDTSHSYVMGKWYMPRQRNA